MCIRDSTPHTHTHTQHNTTQQTTAHINLNPLSEEAFPGGQRGLGPRPRAHDDSGAEEGEHVDLHGNQTGRLLYGAGGWAVGTSDTLRHRHVGQATVEVGVAKLEVC